MLLCSSDCGGNERMQIASVLLAVSEAAALCGAACH